jgi:hypothetical protein
MNYSQFYIKILQLFVETFDLFILTFELFLEYLHSLLQLSSIFFILGLL